MPDVGSVPAKVTVTGALYQPFAFGGRSAVAAVTVGLSVSILNCKWKLTVDVPSVALQSRVSLLERNVLTAGHVVSVAPAGVMFAVTALTYQPLSPAVPEVTEYVIVGPAAEASGATISSAAAHPPSAKILNDRTDSHLDPFPVQPVGEAQKAGARSAEYEERERGEDRGLTSPHGSLD